MKVFLHKIYRILKDPKSIGRIFLNIFSPFFPDKLYLSLQYRMHFGRKMQWDSPLTYNEKIQWLKLYDRNPIYIHMVDKYSVKQYVAALIGAQYVIPLIGIWDSPEQIDIDSLPDQFVLKCTHDSGGIIICKDKKLKLGYS